MLSVAGGRAAGSLAGEAELLPVCLRKPELMAASLLSEPALSDHLRLRQRPQLQPLPLPHCAQWLRGRAGQLPEGPER